MNLGISELPARCDVLVVGAGPAGSAAAQWLARAGRDVVLIDQQAFPRDKVCGDGLIADALRALDRLGVKEQVLAEARCSATLGCIGPRGGRIDVPGSLAVLPRKRLDEIICRAAVAAGARMFAPLRFVAPLREAGRVVGAELEHDGVIRPIRAAWLVLATGAQPQATLAAGLCERRAPSGIALRGYVRNPAMTPRITSLEVVWHKRLSPGYGWIFPCGDDLFNIGVGVAQDGAERRQARPGRIAPQPARGLRRVPVALCAGARAGRRRRMAGTARRGAEGRAAALLARGCEVRGAGRAGLRRGRGQHLRPHRRGHRQGDGDGAACSRGDPRRRLPARPPSAPTTAPGSRRCGRASNSTRRRTGRSAIRGSSTWLVWSAQRSPRRLQRLAGVLEETYLPKDTMSLRGVLRRVFDLR